MSLKKKHIKPKLSLLKLKLYYKQLLNILYILEKKQNTSFILVNNQGLLSFYLNSLNFYEKYDINLRYCKLNLKVYNYLVRKKKIKILFLSNYSIFFNFNYILQVENKLLFDKTFIEEIKKLNTISVNFFYIKTASFVKLISFDFFYNFLDKVKINTIFIKLIKLLILHRLTLLRNLFVFCVKKPINIVK